MDKQMTTAQMVAQLRDGMTIGIGGWGPRRKPMALVREILRSDLKDLTVVAYGGADVGLLCAAGKVKKLIFAFVSLDFIPLEPYFRKARQDGAIEVMEIDEGMLLLGLRAAAMNVPFIPTAVGLGTDVLRHNPEIKLIASPYADGRDWVAMPALKLDAAWCTSTAPMHVASARSPALTTTWTTCSYGPRHIPSSPATSWSTARGSTPTRPVPTRCSGSAT